jgi:hypothetical protein
MSRATSGSRVRVAWAGGATALGIVLVLVSAHAAAQQEAPTFEVWDFGVVPRPALETVLLSMEPVQQELKLSDDQKKEQETIAQGRFQKIRQARAANKEAAKFIAARDAIFKETEAAYLATFKPEQRERLDQIQLQAQGPIAFVRDDRSPGANVGPPLAERLKLSDDQVRKIRAIAEEGQNAIMKAAGFPIALDPKDKPTPEAIRKLVESPEFREAKRKASQTSRDAWAAVIRRIEDVLTEDQRASYRKLLGAPFDLSRLRTVAPEQERQFEINVVSQALGVGGAGGGGGQRADPDFDTKVARPAYASGERHPRVLFDEAHHNFHTASGRYKPFAELITHDGYQVIPNREKFSREFLQKGDILIIANALGAEGMGQPGASDPAFTDAECDAVRDWVREGGALLFITDHAPMGAAAECLAKRFDVSMSKGATSDPVNSEGGDTSLVFTRQNHLLGDHPITRGRDDSERVNRVQTFTGTSLKGPAGSTPILKLADTALDLSIDDGKPVSAAGRAQGLALSVGKGRIVVLGEAAELSAQVIGNGEKFGMNVPGIDNRQMALNVMHWLSDLLEPREAEKAR